jgi:hypothetical protein
MGAGASQSNLIKSHAGSGRSPVARRSTTDAQSALGEGVNQRWKVANRSSHKQSENGAALILPHPADRRAKRVSQL